MWKTEYFVVEISVSLWLELSSHLFLSFIDNQGVQNEAFWCINLADDVI